LGSPLGAAAETYEVDVEGEPEEAAEAEEALESAGMVGMGDGTGRCRLEPSKRWVEAKMGGRNRAPSCGLWTTSATRRLRRINL